MCTTFCLFFMFLLTNRLIEKTLGRFEKMFSLKLMFII
jgi:hypothetical protein